MVDMKALKEWAVVCRALEEGRQTVLLRKGGILEFREGFEVKHDRFMLFPTYEHQSRPIVHAPKPISLTFMPLLPSFRYFISGPP